MLSFIEKPSYDFLVFLVIILLHNEVKIHTGIFNYTQQRGFRMKGNFLPVVMCYTAFYYILVCLNKMVICLLYRYGWKDGIALARLKQ